MTHELIVNTDKFPHGMKRLGDQLQAQGLKFGIYLWASEIQCGHEEYLGANDGSYGHGEQDAALIASFGVGSPKYDSCTQVNMSYGAMQDALNKTGRPIFHLIQGLGGAEVVGLANARRTTPDIASTSVLARALLNDPFASYSGPGSFTMPGIFEVGGFYNNDTALPNAEGRSMSMLPAVPESALWGGRAYSGGEPTSQMPYVSPFVSFTGMIQLLQSTSQYRLHPREICASFVFI